MSAKVEKVVAVGEMSDGERNLLHALRAATEHALDEGVDPNHVLSILSALFVKTAIAVGIPIDKLDELVEGLQLTIAAEQDVGVNRDEAN